MTFARPGGHAASSSRARRRPRVVAHVAGEAGAPPRSAVAHLDAHAAEALHGGEADLVGDVVADEHRDAPGERRLCRNASMARPLLAPPGLASTTILPRSRVSAGRLLHGALHDVQALGLELGCLPVVQRHRAALVLDQQVGMARGERLGGILDLFQRMGGQQRSSRPRRCAVRRHARPPRAGARDAGTRRSARSGGPKSRRARRPGSC